ncbi:RNA polymerase sigma factor RpoD/SigA [Rhodocytophaga aerolata]|jgi:RNA polymerase primary sigma factor|uniref:RNA polymerase sigma factor RpoD/SigA n=1 Tax=Rhodocytophaga aerolata TaxID=455078 RepID=A0ABT8QZ97_9BACT|nr:RNA polymerase sigma factor RpoD/SigA [Rhodocytophaga aerolata]MDO1445161.1 RNA polymerase sigma factor RpoD/SigA [Rhodocytophaga aerolata]
MRQLKITNLITNRDSATIEKYFNDISKVELLLPEEEVELARRIKQGDQIALERLVKANLRFVVSVAKQYHHSKVPLNDLINEGNLGLIKAAKMYDETKGFKFISYAVWWIRQSIMDALNNTSRIVRIPANKIGELSKISQASSHMEQRFEREPTIEEVAEFMGINVDDIKSANTASIRQSSLDAPFEEDEGNSLLDVISNPDADAADSLLTDRDSLRIELERLLSVLSEREREVIKQAFGLGYEYTLSLEDIADNLGLTRERVRQIKESALRKLRNNSGTRLLQPYLA